MSHYRFCKGCDVPDLSGWVGHVPGNVALPVQHAVLAPDLDAGLVAPSDQIRNVNEIFFIDLITLLTCSCPG